MGWSKVRAAFGSLLFWPTNSVVCQRASHAWHNSWRSRPEIAEENRYHRRRKFIACYKPRREAQTSSPPRAARCHTLTPWELSLGSNPTFK